MAPKEFTDSTALSPSGTDFDRTVLPIIGFHLGLGLKLKPSLAAQPLAALRPEIEVGLGTGFCIDPECRLIGTNYHVAASVRIRKIKGVEVVHQYLATGPDDEGASWHGLSSEHPLGYNPSRDLAILELRRPLAGYHGVPFSVEDLEVGEEVDIYAYPKESISPKRSLLRFAAAFKGKTTAGLMAFDYTLSRGKPIRGGASGGLVVDHDTGRIVGILNEVAGDGEAVAFAVPVECLADFLGKVEPYLVHAVFPRTEYISPVSADHYPQFVPPRSSGLVQRPEEPGDVKMLRSKAQQLADSMSDFIALQRFDWGSGNKPPAASAEYEVQVVDGYQRFREYPDGKELKEAPLPRLSNAINTGGAWAELPNMVATHLGLKIQQAADAVIDAKRVRVFQYRADVEDGVCQFKSVADFLLYSRTKVFTVSCYGEVWTDELGNILRISGHLELPGRWKNYRVVMTYGWLRKGNENPRLVPLTLLAEAELHNKTYWCRNTLMNYRVFGAKVKILWDKSEKRP